MAAYSALNEDDYDKLRNPGSKMLLTQMNGTRNVAVVVAFDEESCEVTIKYERNEFMKQDLLDRLRDDEFNLDLREYEHMWIDPQSDLYCEACHSMELDHLFVCNHPSHAPNQVAFHACCLDVHLGHVIPNNDTARSWHCPMHSNVLQKIDPSKLRKRRGDYDFEFDRPQKKRKLTVSDPDWLALPEGVDAVYPIHSSCHFCWTERVECDGYRPCGNCSRYVQDEHMDLSQEKFISMNEQELQHEIDLEACKHCTERNCTFEEFENDQAMQKWLQLHNDKLYHQYVQEKREKDQRRMDEAEENEEDEDEQNEQAANTDTNANKPKAQQISQLLASREAQELTEIKFAFKQPEYVDSVPVYARYSCPKCQELFSDKYRYKMHLSWAHQQVIASKIAFTDTSEWKMLNHFEPDKPLKYACPYAGCLRGANSSQEIEDHILRHHDITDPTKPKEVALSSKNKKALAASKKKKKQSANSDAEEEDMIRIEGVPFLTQMDKRKISKIWLESTSFQIDRKNRQELIKNFVSSVVSENLDRFDSTTKRLQTEYRQNMERLANRSSTANSRHVPSLPPPLIQQPDTSNVAPDSGPRSLWE
eukprot:CAMPEP_0197025526 /NCGR_PEP_ID=MMETSP1384-20130603/5828_1 /TAXON_ID=29189 /ORGANISM="Ammonia sp." /LENGTH=591 /DNA_ID=CAMNT_0042454063 /DNA_START=40 /DNA_END=1815 /DNA_ORIENTATION=+